jgi:hypothetical protein
MSSTHEEGGVDEDDDEDGARLSSPAFPSSSSPSPTPSEAKQEDVYESSVGTAHKTAGRKRQTTLLSHARVVPPKRPRLAEHCLQDEERRVRIRERRVEDEKRKVARKRDEKQERDRLRVQKTANEQQAKQNLLTATLKEHLHQAWKADFLDEQACQNPFSMEDMHRIDQLVCSNASYSGHVAFDDKELVKSKGARWNPDNKSWDAPNRDVAHELVTTTNWKLVHLSSNCIRHCARSPLQCKNTSDEIPAGLYGWTVRQFQRAFAFLNPVQTAPSTSTTTSEPVPQKVEGSVTEGSVSIADFVRSVRSNRQRRELCIREDSESELESIRSMGIDPLAVDLFDGMPEMGPHSGISNAARLRRGLKFNVAPSAWVARVTRDVIATGKVSPKMLSYMERSIRQRTF